MIKKRTKFKSIIAAMLCMMLCIPSISVFAAGGADRTTGAYAWGDEPFFKVENLSVGESSSSIYKEVFKDGNYVLGTDEITFRFGTHFAMDSKWGTPDTSGWEIGDYLIFNLPMNDIVSYPNGAGNLNSGYGTWEVFDNGKVKFVLSAQALLSTSLYDGLFETEANMRNMGETSTTGTTHVEEIAIKWNFERGAVVGAPYGGNALLNMVLLSLAEQEGNMLSDRMNKTLLNCIKNKRIQGT